MRLYYLIAVYFLYQLSVFSQDKVVALHPAVGDTIEFTEKKMYFLFPEIEDTDFNNGQIFTGKNGFYLVCGTKSSKIIHNIDPVAFNQYRLNIEKLYAYYISSTNADTLNISTNELKSLSAVPHINLINAEMLENLPKESRRYQYLKNEAEKLGLWGEDKENYIKTSGYIELFSTKKKK